VDPFEEQLQIGQEFVEYDATERETTEWEATEWDTDVEEDS
jgi:hypothetical protein